LPNSGGVSRRRSVPRDKGDGAYKVPHYHPPREPHALLLFSHPAPSSKRRMKEGGESRLREHGISKGTAFSVAPMKRRTPVAAWKKNYRKKERMVRRRPLSLFRALALLVAALATAR
jgi:hypothetical protein